MSSASQEKPKAIRHDAYEQARRVHNHHHHHHHRHRQHNHYPPAMCAYLIYDLSSPVFSTSEISAIFSPTPSSPTTNDGWGGFLGSRIEHITSRPPSLSPTAICIGEYSSASVAHPCAVHGVGQIFRGWDSHAAAKKFKQMIASTPVIQPTGNGPAEILKACLDAFTGTHDPLDVMWVLKFLLVPQTGSQVGGGGGSSGGGDWAPLCRPENVDGRDWREVALVCVRKEGFRMEEVGCRLVEFGKLFSVEVVIVSSLG